MSFLEMAINAIQQGSPAEGARLLRVALRGELGTPLTPELRGLAYLWLAETTDDAGEKRRYVSAAAQADPNNAEARQRLAALLAPMPNPPPASAPAPSSTGTMFAVSPTPVPASSPYMPAPDGNASSAAYSAYSAYAPAPANPAPAQAVSVPPQVAEFIVQVIGGSARHVVAPGTGVFVSENVVATTHAVVGSQVRLTLGVIPGGQSTGQPARQLAGRVIRAFPDLDLVLIVAEGVRLNALLPITPLQRLPDDSRLFAVPFGGQAVPTRQRSTKRTLAAHWIPTDLTEMPDSGGGEPLFDEQGFLVGLLTRDTSRATAHFHGLHITAIRRALEVAIRELNDGQRRQYCTVCGSASRALGDGLLNCEVCGGLSSLMQGVPRTPQPRADAYSITAPVRCIHMDCQANFGLYAGRCLRCGREQLRR